MTENKRFTVEDDDADIWEDNHFLAVAYNHINAKKITKRLNKLADENEKLKQQLKTRVIVNKQYEELQRLKKENEQLKKELESFKPIIFESDGKPVTLYKKGDV